MVSSKIRVSEIRVSAELGFLKIRVSVEFGGGRMVRRLHIHE